MMNTMKDADLKRNASGYYDEPCYKACTALPKAGEIWQHSRSGDYILILAVNDRVCSILKLTDRECTDAIQVVCKSVMYTSPAMVSYAFIESIGDYVKSLKEDEFKGIQTAVGEALGITAVSAVPHDHINALEDKVLRLTKERDEAINLNGVIHHDLLRMTHERDDAQKERDEAHEIANQLNAESFELSIEIKKLKIYKDMYMDLIDKLVSVRGAVND